MFFYCKVSAKHNSVLKSFSQLLMKLKKSATVIRYFSKSNKRKFITILKSPHVNKTAQEQFEFRFYNQEFLIYSLKPLTFFIFLKKIQNISFPGIKLKIKGLLNFEKKNKNFLKVVNPDNLILNNNNPTLNFQKNYIQLFDCYGELYLKKLYYISINI